MSTTTLKITGMSCSHCVRAITLALEQIPGVSRAVIDLSAARAVVDYDAAVTTPRALANAVMDEGYVAEEVG